MNPQLHVCLWNVTSVVVLFQLNNDSSPGKCDWRHKKYVCHFFLIHRIKRTEWTSHKLMKSKTVDLCDLRYLLLPRVLLWRADTSSEVIVMHALLHRRAWWIRNCGAHKRPPINYLKDQLFGSHLCPSSTEHLERKFTNIWDFIDLQN